ncbi:MAG: hypothetical protein LUE93_12610, partial [Bacteroides sp.]|nr:hypothetical protein [Bacteroides sp.]
TGLEWDVPSELNPTIIKNKSSEHNWGSPAVISFADRLFKFDPTHHGSLLTVHNLIKERLDF